MGSLPADPAIVGSALGLVANANLVHVEYAHVAADLEDYVVHQVAQLAGMDPERASGLFVSGGTIANLYGHLLGIRKAFRGKKFGGHLPTDYRFITSVGAHYSSQTVLGVLGADVQHGIVRIQLDAANRVDIDDLWNQLESCWRMGIIVPSVFLTAGTTDTFAVDDVEAVHDVIERLSVKYDLPQKPHLHVDAAVGWPMLMFNDYDMDANELAINGAAMHMLRRNQPLFRALRLADSVSVDFHKLGFVPYSSSMILIKNRDDLQLLANDPAHFSYFSAVTEGHDHFMHTIECSRGAAGIFGAHAALQAMGVEGYRLLVAHSVQNAEYLRHKLLSHPVVQKQVQLVAAQNAGPSVGFRLYPPHRPAASEYGFETTEFVPGDEDYMARVRANSAFHKRVFDHRGDNGLYTSFVQALTHSNFDHMNRVAVLSGEKAVMLNPKTRHHHIDDFVDSIAVSLAIVNEEEGHCR